MTWHRRPKQGEVSALKGGQAIRYDGHGSWRCTKCACAANKRWTHCQGCKNLAPMLPIIRAIADGGTITFGSDQ